MIKQAKTHKFEVQSIDNNHEYYNNYGQRKFQECSICKKCNLEVFNMMDYDIFFCNGVEVFHTEGSLEEIDLTCDELLIKNIIE